MKERFGLEMEFASNNSQSGIEALLVANGVDASRDDGSRRYSKWTVSSDGSVRTNDLHPYAIELKSPPLYVHEMVYLKKALSALKAQGRHMVGASCGLHVHVQVDSFETMKKIYRIWARYEDDIIKFFPVSRRSNRYCKPVKGSLSTIIRACENGRTNGDRYYMVNNCCFTRIGTIEFRGHSGTLNYQKIKRWVLFVTRIVEIAKRYDDAWIKESLRTRYDVFDYLDLNGKTKAYFMGREKRFVNVSATT